MLRVIIAMIAASSVTAMDQILIRRGMRAIGPLEHHAPEDLSVISPQRDSASSQH